MSKNKPGCKKILGCCLGFAILIFVVVGGGLWWANRTYTDYSAQAGKFFEKVRDRDFLYAYTYLTSKEYQSAYSQTAFTEYVSERGLPDAAQNEKCLILTVPWFGGPFTWAALGDSSGQDDFVVVLMRMSAQGSLKVADSITIWTAEEIFESFRQAGDTDGQQAPDKTVPPAVAKPEPKGIEVLPDRETVFSITELSADISITDGRKRLRIAAQIVGYPLDAATIPDGKRFSVTATIVTPAGKKLSSGKAVNFPGETPADGTAGISFAIPVDKHAPGEYSLLLEVRDLVSDKTAEKEIGFVLK